LCHCDTKGDSMYSKKLLSFFLGLSLLATFPATGVQAENLEGQNATKALRPPPGGGDGTRPQPVRPEPVRPQPVRPEPVRPQPVRPEPVRPQPVRPEPVRPQPVRPEPVRPQPVRPEPVRPEPVRPEPVRPRPTPPVVRPNPTPRPPVDRPVPPPPRPIDRPITRPTPPTVRPRPPVARPPVVERPRPLPHRPLPPFIRPPHRVDRPPFYYYVPRCRDLAYGGVFSPYPCRADWTHPWYPYPQRPLPPIFHRPIPYSPYQEESVDIRIGRYVNYEAFDLFFLGGLDSPRYRGAVVNSVEVHLGQRDYGVGVSLITNGFTADADNSANGITYLVPRYGALIGQDLREMFVEVNGYVWVDHITVNLRRSGLYSPYYANRDFTLTQEYSLNLADYQVLDLSDVVDLYNYANAHIVSVEITARSVSQNSDFSAVRFFVNDRETDRVLVDRNGDTRTFFIYGPDRLNTDIYSLELMADGDVVIDNISVRLTN